MNPAFSSLLAALARELDLPGIETRDDDPSCLLGIDDFEVSLRCLSTDQVMIFTVVAPLPARKRDELYAALLDANTFFHQTQGFTLAAREDTGVTLQGTLPLAALTDANVGTWVGNFVNVAAHWQERCLACDTAADAPEAPAVDPALMGGMLRI